LRLAKRGEFVPPLREFRMAASAQTESPPSLDWREIGRGGEPDHDARWTTWTAPLPDGGALYRSLVVAEGVAIVSVELQARARKGGGGNEARTIHRRRCPAPGDSGGGGAGGTVGALLDAADEAAAAAAAAARGAAVGRGQPPSP
jgi:hypothetical protein